MDIRILGFLALLMAAFLNGMEKNVDQIALVSKEGAEFRVPKPIALQAGQIRALLEGPLALDEQASQKLEFSSISTDVLESIAQIMRSLQEHTTLKGQVLLDSVAKEVYLVDPLALIQAMDFLDFKAGIAVVVRKLVNDRQALAAGIKLIQLGAITPSAAKELARYYYLLSHQRLEGVDKNSYGFSIQDYLDYWPEQIKIDEHGWLNLKDRAINNLEGLVNIPNRVAVIEFDLSFNQITDITSGAFAGFQNLKQLSLNHNQITTIDSQAFAELKNLRWLYLNNNQITIIKPDAFVGLQSLLILYLNNNQITTIDSQAFSDLPSLIWLFLGNNQLTTILPQTFAGLQSLEMLSLSNNLIKVINTQLFTGLRNLSELNLENNQITTFTIHPSSELQHLALLYLSGNHLSQETRAAIQAALPQAEIEFGGIKDAN